MNKKQKKGKVQTGNSIQLVRKGNELVEARYKFDIWETRLYGKMLTMIKPSDSDLLEYKIYVGELLKDIGLSDAGENYVAVKEAARKLLTKTIKIRRQTSEGEKEFETGFLNGVDSFVDPKDGSHITIQFHPNLKPYLLELQERYLQYDIRNLWGLNSVYSVRMYELLKQYEKIKKRYFTLDDLKYRLAIDPAEYKKYSHFKDKILLRAQADLGNHTDISFSFEEHKTGRQITAYTFFIYSNSTKREGKELPEKVENGNGEADQLDSIVFVATLDQVKGWGITEATLKGLFLEHGEGKVKGGVICTLEGLKKGKVGDSVGGFFVKAVQEGWTSSSQVKREQAKAKETKAKELKQKAGEELKVLEAKLEEVLEARKLEVNEIIRTMTQQDPLLAGTAVGKIIGNVLVKRSLESQTGFVLDNLGIEDWRSNKPLRDTLIRKIEDLHSEEFKEVQTKFDGQVKQLRGRVEELRNIVSK